jgi:hypothetical protein
MNLEQLNNEMPYKWRVQSFSKLKPQGQCVAYIDARDAQKRLDEVCGKEKWQAIYYEVGSMLFCKVGIKIDGEWVWKSDTGSESNIEKEKGHSSDAFKRACVLWGIGRFLYDMKIQYVDANEKKTNSNYPYVIDKNEKRVWDLTEFINNKNKSIHPKNKKLLMTKEQSNKFIELCNQEQLKQDDTAVAYGISKTITSNEFETKYMQILQDIKNDEINFNLSL